MDIAILVAALKFVLLIFVIAGIWNIISHFIARHVHLYENFMNFILWIKNHLPKKVH